MSAAAANKRPVAPRMHLDSIAELPGFFATKVSYFGTHSQLSTKQEHMMKDQISIEPDDPFLRISNAATHSVVEELSKYIQHI